MKQHYRVKLFTSSNSAADKAILEAALVNSGKSDLNLKSIKAIAEAEKCPNTMCELINEDEPTALCIDVKVGNNGWSPAAIIELVEIVELKESVDDLQNAF